MGKSLTETAKSILMNEGAIPSVSSSGNNPDRDATSTTVNKSSLKPGSKTVEGRFSTPGSTAPAVGGYADLGPAPDKLMAGDNYGAKASAKIGKDTSRSGKSAVPAEKAKKQAEVMEEDFEISEELEAFIAEMVEEGYSEDEIAEAIDENFEVVSEDYELDEEEQLDEISAALARRAQRAAKDEAQYAADNSYGIRGAAYKAQAERLGAKADEKEKAEKKAKQIASLSSGKRAKMKMDEDYELEEEYEVDMSEHIEALFAGEELSEEFKEKALMIFEAAVREKVEEEIALLEEAYAETLEEQVAQIQEDLSSNVDDYLNYVVEQWVGENEVAIDAGLRSELTEDFISGLRNLFSEHYIDIPEDRVNVVEEMGATVADLEQKLNEEIERNVQLTRYLNESKQNEILLDAAYGLTDTQAERLKSLSEGIDFTSLNEYAQKINILRESYFSSSVNSDNALDRTESYGDGKSMISEELNGPMAAYVKTLGRTVK